MNLSQAIRLLNIQDEDFITFKTKKTLHVIRSFNYGQVRNLKKKNLT